MSTLVRRVVVPMAALLMVTPTAWSQSTPVWAGATVGANFADWAGDALIVDTRIRRGFNAGAFLRLPASDKVTIEPRISLSQEGFRYPASDAYEDAWLRLTYLQFPVLARLTLASSSSIRPFLVGGPSLGFNVGCDIKVNGATTLTAACDHPDVGLKIQFTEFSGSLGAGVDIRNWTASLRYKQSLNSALNTWADYPYKAKNRVVILEISRVFRIGNLPKPPVPIEDPDDEDS